MINTLFKSKTIISLLVVSILFLLLSLIFLLTNINDLSYPLILHFNSFEGVDLTGSSSSLWSILSIGFLVVVINSFLGHTFFKRERILTYILFFINVIVSILTFISIAQIISIN